MLLSYFIEKEGILLKNISFESVEDLCMHMADSYDSVKCEDSEDVAVIAKYPEMREIIKELLCIGYDLHSCDIEDEDYDGYCDEYICTIYDKQLWVEKMMRKNGYLIDESNVIYLLDNCSSKVIPQITSKNIFEVSICDDDDSCDGDCDNCDLHETESDEMPGFSYSFDNAMGSTHVSFYSTDKDLVEKMAKLYME